MKQTPVCSNCVAENVKVDAFAVWDKDRQRWEVSETFYKGAYCETCDGGTPHRLEECR